MKKLQNDFTTPEQSKHLLELGVPANSANCIFTRFSRDEKWKRRFIKDIVSEQPFCNQDFYLPCWSALRLLEIIDICELTKKPDLQVEEYPSVTDVMDMLHLSYVEYLVKVIELSKSSKLIDFSKLED